nr:MAG TPA: minor tail protein [Caudoviricetes sp.]
MATKNVNILLKLQDKFTSKMEKAGKITTEQKFAMAKCSDEVMRFSRTVRGGFGSAVKNIGKVGAALAGISFAGITAGFIGMAESTEEYRRAMGKLNTAYQSVGFSSDVAQQAYSGFYSILGDTDTATEASQLLSQLARNQEDVSKWTKIAAGVSGKFGDSIPINSLMESANESLRTGKVTGVLADALNWAGKVSEDQMNAKLAATNETAKRAQIIMDTLADTYYGAADAFYANNKALIQARQNEVAMQKVTGALGEASVIAKGKLWELLGVASDGSVSTGSVLEWVLQKVEAFKAKIETIDVSKYAPIITEAVQKVQTGIGIAWKIISPILEQAVKHADVLIPAVLGVVTAISGVSIVADVAGKVMTFVSTIKSVITTVKAAGGIMSWVASGPIGLIIAGIAAAVVVVVLLIKNFDKVKAVAQTVFGGIKTFITTLVDAFKSLGRQIKDAFWGAFNWVKKKIQPIIDWISDKIGKIKSGFEKIGNFFSNLGFGSSANTGSQYSLSANGGKATGTPYFRGGLTRVNEGGRGEIMNLPNGTQIIPHDVAKKQQKANNISVQVTIQGNVIGNRAFMEQTGAYIANKILAAQGVV